MANLKVFVSSTCYDLTAVRSQLRNFLVGMGYEPVMSDYSDVLYDPRVHTHRSCIQEVENCDMLILLIGSRFGGKSLPTALEEIDFEGLKSASFSSYVLDNKEKLSITQLEVCKAIELSTPIFSFINEKVLHDHNVYEKNKDKPIISEISFPSIEKPESAKYIFEFINFLRHRTENNSFCPFSKNEDIESFLRKQWSALFQRLLLEQRLKHSESRRMDYMTEQLEDLKTAIMTSITAPDLKETARGAIRFRRIIDFVKAFNFDDLFQVLMTNMTWEELLNKAGVLSIKQIPDPRSSSRNSAALILEDGTFYQTRFPYGVISRLSVDWEAFVQTNEESKKAIIDSILEAHSISMRQFHHVEEAFTEIYPENGGQKSLFEKDE